MFRHTSASPDVRMVVLSKQGHDEGRDAGVDAHKMTYSLLRPTDEQVLRQRRSSKSSERDSKRTLQVSRLAAHLLLCKDQRCEYVAAMPVTHI